MSTTTVNKYILSIYFRLCSNRHYRNRENRQCVSNSVTHCRLEQTELVYTCTHCGSGACRVVCLSVVVG